MKYLLSRLVLAVLSCAALGATTLTSSALVGMDPSRSTDCVGASASGTSSAYVSMAGCGEVPRHEAGPWTASTFILADTSSGRNSILYTGGSTMDGFFSSASSEYLETYRFESQGQRELYADFSVLDTATAFSGSACDYITASHSSLSLYVNGAATTLAACQSGTIHVDLGSFDTSQALNLDVRLALSYTGFPLTDLDLNVALQGFSTGDVGGPATGGISLIPEPASYALLGGGLIALWGGRRLRRRS